MEAKKAKNQWKKSLRSKGIDPSNYKYVTVNIQNVKNQKS